MDTTEQNIGRWVSVALIATVLTQIVYMATLGGPTASDPSIGVTPVDTQRYFDQRWPEIAGVWMTELAAFITLFIAATIALARRAAAPLAWAALALSALTNIAQIAMGLALFRPAAAAGAAFEPILDVIVQGAFFFYFLAKVLIGLASAGFGWALFKTATGASRYAGMVAIAVGMVAAAVNFLALPQGMSWVLPAGATGTLAALTAALSGYVLTRQSGAQSAPS